MKQEELTTLNSYLSFSLDQECFGVNVGKVIEILEVPHITRIPKAPPFMRGVINLRGTVLPVVDTRLKFGLAPKADTINTCIIVFSICIGEEQVMVGALVDAVQEVFEMPESELRPTPSMGGRYKAEFIRGMARRDDEFIMVLDVDRIFAHEEILDLQLDLEALKA
ncbi:chemotaxis protein CheW [Cesiribacter andamanensis]|uniref:Chemotaxis protein CheW n=1 Tax=Cesiribacter andamanensis AMV16 TaxID=1279009 RepID=M7N9U8_9BACT|nr:chemotaxis protein CheW [Cesiribacter andamanensis]EMR03981.1 Chemotaxis protein CheW [Cesiribacter andamanensis AMV16]